MKTLHVFLVLAWMARLAAPEGALAHGRELRINAVNETIKTSHAPGANPFSALIFGQDDPDAESDGLVPLPGVGPAILWSFPGLTLSGFQSEDSLWIETIGHADHFGSDAQRYVWHWNPVTEQVAATDASFHFVAVADSQLSIQSFDATSTQPPGEHLITPTLAGKQGFHNHDLVRFALDGGNAPAGLYGVFASFGSPGYERSEPVLLVFNHGMAAVDAAPASEAIYAAARLGDFDRNGRIEPQDYDLWAQQLNDLPQFAGIGADGNLDGVVNAADYTVWRDAVKTLATTSVPEPTGATLLLIVMTWSCISGGGLGGRARATA